MSIEKSTTTTTIMQLAAGDKRKVLAAGESVVITIAGQTIVDETVPQSKKWNLVLDLSGTEEDA